MPYRPGGNQECGKPTAGDGERTLRESEKKVGILFHRACDSLAPELQVSRNPICPIHPHPCVLRTQENCW